MHHQGHEAVHSSVVGKVGFGIGLLLVAAPGCDGSPQSTNNCAEGSERCPCYGNGTCDEGLTCLSDRCVIDDATGGATSGGRSSRGGGAGSAQDGTFTPAASGGTVASGGTIAASGGTPTASGGTASTAAGAPPVGVNLIHNGDFSQQKNYWMLTDYTGATNLWTSVASGSYCFGAESAFQYSLGWPASATDALNLAVGTTYRLSFSLRANASYSVAIKVRELMMSQLASFSTTMLVAASEQPATHEFTVTSTFLPSGLYFSGTMAESNYLCVSAVSLVRLQ